MPEVSYDTLGIIERLVRVETKLDTLNDSKNNAHMEIIKDVADHEIRIRSVERMMWIAMGAVTVINLVGSYFITVYN